MTNFEYIKKQYQTPAAMAKFLAENSCNHCSKYNKEIHICSDIYDSMVYCEDGIKQWLESEREEAQ